MTLTQLAYAVAVDTYRHFGRAAEHCHVSQPTLSMQLQKLEEELGVQLFDRSRKPILPTPIGERVLAQARVILRECERLYELVRENQETVQGTLKLGVIPTLSPYLMPLVTPLLQDQYPELTVQVDELTTEQILEALITDRIDAGLIATEEDRPGLRRKALFREPFVAYLGAGHPLLANSQLDPAQLRLEDIWLLKEGHCFRDQVLQVCSRREEAGPVPQLRFESGNLETLRLLVDQLGGVTLLPLLATHYLSPEARARVRYFREPVPHRTIYLIYVRTHLKRRLLDAYVSVLQQSIRAILPPPTYTGQRLLT
ncbi:hydrogen peroxide-inducible genes activator [Rhodothermus profundi]|uniref:LysR family transcriptional regulator, hydrogen peroxide-inducible genes activator n=1 Tax=Rhodothermus profundi TaxID=633813 RepID=A0A1M6R944_9BACT|nr:hydrogen peroxide-inducible genes activator [Rhodothermus profundi]SHK29009.1 LysR family transcriptional regulator, hydrogen peroxide-inducible genes activator [Rhodothermus profundi]